MSEVEILFGAAQGLMLLVLSMGGWVLRRAIEDGRETERALGLVRERLVRVEATIEGVSRLEGKLDHLAETVTKLRQDVASLIGPR